MRPHSFPARRIFTYVASLTALTSIGCTVTDAGLPTNTAGAAGNGTGGSASTAGTGNAAAGVSGNLGTAGTAPGASGSTGSGGNISVGTAGAAGSGGASGAGTGGTVTGGAGGTGTGGNTSTAGAGGMSGGGGGGGGGPVIGGTGRTGMSAGCNKNPPPMDSTTKFILHEVHVTGLDPIYLAGGKYADTSGKYDLTFRPYSVQLPNGYDPSTPYAVTLGGGGCGGSAQNFAGNPGGGLQMAPNGTTIQIGLSYLNTCFHDGGPSIGNRTDTPDEPYFRAVFAELAANYCIDLSKVFIGGYSSGAWEAFTLGCAASDIIRGIGTDEGGLRTMHPACKAPIAAVMVAGTADTENPIGPLDPVADKGAVDRLGSLGSAPGRDEILARNGCTGTATAPYTDPKFGQCVTYTGCPAKNPVVWCALPGVGHNNSSYGGQNYTDKGGVMWNVLSKLPP